MLTSLEFRDAVATLARDKRDLHRQTGDSLQHLAPNAVQLLMEVQTSTRWSQFTNGMSCACEVLGLNEHVGHQVALTADRLVDEGVGGAEAAGHIADVTQGV